MHARGTNQDKPRFDTVGPSPSDGIWEVFTRNKGGNNGIPLSRFFESSLDKAKTGFHLLWKMNRKYYSVDSMSQFGGLFKRFVNNVIFNGRQVIDTIDITLSANHGLPENAPRMVRRGPGRPSRVSRIIPQQSHVNLDSVSITELSVSGSDESEIEPPSRMTSWDRRLWEHGVDGGSGLTVGGSDTDRGFGVGGSGVDAGSGVTGGGTGTGSDFGVNSSGVGGSGPHGGSGLCDEPTAGSSGYGTRYWSQIEPPTDDFEPITGQFSDTSSDNGMETN